MGTNPTQNPTYTDPKPTPPALAAGGSGACAVCKHQRRKCPPDCPLAPHFPAYKQRDFLNVHKLFGVRNLTRAFNSIDERNRHDFMVSMIYEANARAADPVGGCCTVINNLKIQLYYSRAELDRVNEQLAFYRSKHPQLQRVAAAYDPPVVHVFEGSSSDLIGDEKQRIVVGDQGFPFIFAEKELKAENQ